MGSILLPRSYQTQEHGSAATLRCSRLVMLAAATAPVFLAAGALAQVQETIPPVLSSGLHETTTLQTSVIARPSQRPATQSLPDAASLPPIGSIGAASEIPAFSGARCASGFGACGAPPCLDGRSSDPRLRRPVREFLGF